MPYYFMDRIHTHAQDYICISRPRSQALFKLGLRMRLVQLRNTVTVEIVVY